MVHPAPPVNRAEDTHVLLALSDFHAKTPRAATTAPVNRHTSPLGWIFVYDPAVVAAHL
jgi:hypothetical protein